MTNMEELRQLSKAQILMGFVASCIEDVANRLGVDYLEVYKRGDDRPVPHSVLQNAPYGEP